MLVVLDAPVQGPRRVGANNQMRNENIAIPLPDGAHPGVQISLTLSFQNTYSSTD